MECELMATFPGLQDSDRVTDTISAVKEKNNLPLHWLQFNYWGPGYRYHQCVASTWLPRRERSDLTDEIIIAVVTLTLTLHTCTMKWTNQRILFPVKGSCDRPADASRSSLPSEIKGWTKCINISETVWSASEWKQPPFKKWIIISIKDDTY